MEENITLDRNLAPQWKQFLKENASILFSAFQISFIATLAIGSIIKDIIIGIIICGVVVFCFIVWKIFSLKRPVVI